MSFRIQKRIKLGKNFGINISKSGFSPSYRTKRGSVSSKGYSIRTGVKGVTYRKTFNKTKNSGCMVIVLFLLSFGLGTICISCIDKNQSDSENFKNEDELVKTDIGVGSRNVNKWYVGGTLHNAKISVWKMADESDKLATCGDFLATTNSNRTIDEIKTMATNLRICINEAIRDHSAMDNSDVSEVASMCMLLMNYNLN